VLAYRAAYPEVAVDLLLSQRMPNLLEDQLDLSVVIARALPDSAYVSQIIANTYCILAASPDYLERHPAPAHPDELADHACVLLSTVDYAPDEWHLKSSAGEAVFQPAGSHFCVNDMGAMAIALRSGAGIGLISGFTAIDDLRAGRLVRVLPEYRTCERNVYAVYSSRQFVDAKIRRFVELLKRQIGAELDACTKELDTRERAI
jgi:DNA-binding transcriptional LysR family regulator